MASEDRLRELEDKYEDYKVYDNRGEKIGKVDDLFVDETDREEYIGVKMGFFGMKSTLIPMDIVRVNEGDRSVEVSESKDHVKGAPSFDDDEDITPDFEDRIRTYFGLEPSVPPAATARTQTPAASTQTGSRANTTPTDHEASNDSAASTADDPGTRVRGREWDSRDLRSQPFYRWSRLHRRRGYRRDADHAPDRGDRDLQGRRTQQDPAPHHTRGDHRRGRPERPQLKRSAKDRLNSPIHCSVRSISPCLLKC